MKNWHELEPDKYCLMNKHFSPGRLAQIEFIVIHHNAGVDLSTEDCYRIWQDREASAHYQVETDGTIGQLVNDWDTAWHSGHSVANAKSIGIEHANTAGAAARWPISSETIEAGAHLVAALCHTYNLGMPIWESNVFPHQYFSQTSCPYQLSGALRDRYMSAARNYYFAMANDQESPKPDMLTDSDRQLLIETHDLCRVIRDQLCGPGSGYPGWPQTGGRTLTDTIAAIAEKQGVPNTMDTKQ